MAGGAESYKFLRNGVEEVRAGYGVSIRAGQLSGLAFAEFCVSLDKLAVLEGCAVYREMIASL